MSTNDSNTVSRRAMVGGVGAGLAVAAATPAAAQGAAQGKATAQPKQDPTEKFPKPPFKKQNQPWPGLASQMDPRPDHGEKSYKGSGRLAGRKALITGGDSGMGARRRHRLCARGRRCRDQLSAGRGARRAARSST